MTNKALKESSQKLQVYEALHSLNEGFERILADLGRLQEFPFLARALLRPITIAVQETRAWVNYDVLETMHSRELDDWARFGRLRRQWEKRYLDPENGAAKATPPRKGAKAAGGRRVKGGKGGRR